MKERGPVFVTAFNPLCMIIVAVLGSIILGEEITLGRYSMEYATEESIHNFSVLSSDVLHSSTNFSIMLYIG